MWYARVAYFMDSYNKNICHRGKTSSYLLVKYIYKTKTKNHPSLPLKKPMCYLSYKVNTVRLRAHCTEPQAESSGLPQLSRKVIHNCMQSVALTVSWVYQVWKHWYLPFTSALTTSACIIILNVCTYQSNLCRRVHKRICRQSSILKLHGLNHFVHFQWRNLYF